MTNQEAIELLKEVEIIDDSMFRYIPKYMEALKMAIVALEEKQAKEKSQKRDDELFRSLKKGER